MTVRAAVPGDAQRIEEIRVAGWQHAYAGLLDADWLAGFGVTQQRIDNWAERISTPRPRSVTLVWGQQQDVSGFAVALPCRDDDAPEAFELAALYVDPTAHRQGVGSALLQAALIGQPVPQVLWVLAGNNAARRFYEQHGFTPDGASKILTVGGAEAPEVRYRRIRATDLG